MRAYLIDPIERRITEVDYDGNYKSIYKLIDCERFDCVRFSDNGDCAYVDDEGLFVENQGFFKIEGYPQPVAGKALVLGTDEEGGSVSPILSFDEIWHKVLFGVLIQIGGRVLFSGASAWKIAQNSPRLKK
jgi:hypothetical protein